MTIKINIPGKKEKVIKVLEPKDIEKIFEDLGKQEFPIKISVQAMKFINSMSSEIDWEDFANWWIKNYAIVAGTHVLKYIHEKHKIDLSE